MRLPAIVGEGKGLVRLLTAIVRELKRMDRDIQSLKKEREEK